MLELAAIGSTPHAAMILADMGADVVRIERPKDVRGLKLGENGEMDSTLRGRRSICLDLRSDEGREAVLSLASHADLLLEGYRPGVVEKLGIGPEVCLGRNPRLIYGRMTGWGQTGPLARSVGHDINYIAVTGALHAMGRRGTPPDPPLNLVGEFGGGSMLLVVGLLSALYERDRSGLGQVIDAAVVDGTVLNSHMTMAVRTMGSWSPERQDNLVDGGAPFYGVYECADGKFVAVGALETQFFDALLEGLAVDPAEVGPQMDKTRWAAMQRLFARKFLSRTRDDWGKHFAETDACVSPVLNWDEAADNPHLAFRGTWVKSGHGRLQAAPAPRFSRTPGAIPPLSTSQSSYADIVSDWSHTSEHVR